LASKFGSVSGSFAAFLLVDRCVIGDLAREICGTIKRHVSGHAVKPDRIGCVSDFGKLTPVGKRSKVRCLDQPERRAEAAVWRRELAAFRFLKCSA
jgi:hypothetical protein